MERWRWARSSRPGSETVSAEADADDSHSNRDGSKRLLMTDSGAASPGSLSLEAIELSMTELCMRRSRLVVAVFLVAAFSVSTVLAQPAWLDAYKEPARRLIEAGSTPFAWERLAELGDTFGNRLS